MRQVTRKGLMTMAAATGVLAAAGGAAHAHSGPAGTAAGSPGVLSGNTVQAPVHVPVNVCGNTVDVVGALNPSVGNSCAGEGGASATGGHAGSGSHEGSGGQGGSNADAHTSDSPGVASGNQIQVPVHVPVNVCGNTVDVLGAGNATGDNGCADGDAGRETPEQPGDPGEPGSPERPDAPGDGPDTPGDRTPPGAPDGNRPDTHSGSRPGADAELARTGSELPMGLVLPVGAGALLAGAVLYRRARAAA
ncbi:chaplin [Streptomyces griseoflavus]|uniref:chaplin n=1 Tax=Streptomyces griseoflavus TaxID=35619 RepID=UPI003D70EFC2